MKTTKKHGNNYTDEDLFKVLNDFYKENNKIPSSLDFQNRMPCTSVFTRRFGSWENVLKVAGINKIEHIKNELIKYLHKFYKEFGKVPTTRDLKNTNGYPTNYGYTKYFGSYKNALIEAELFELRIDKNKNIFNRNPYSEEELLIKLKYFIENKEKIPTCSDIANDQDMPHTSTYESRFGSLNNALLMLGIDPIYTFVEYDENKLINSLKDLYKELGRTPTSRDINKCDYCPADSTYINRFGSLYNAFDIAEIDYIKRSKFYTDEEIIFKWYEVKGKLDRIPLFQDIKKFSDRGVYDSINWRWGNYTNFLKSINELDGYEKYGIHRYETENGTICFSYYEYEITQWLEGNNINHIKEYPYNKVIPNDNSLRRFDWYINKENIDYFIEMFGITGRDDYNLKANAKINDCKNSNINLISIYPEDFKSKTLDEIFSFLS